MPLRHLYYHLVWATKERAPLITPEIEADVYRFIGGKVLDLGGEVLAIGGTDDHVHLVASIPASLSVSDFIGKIKGASSRRAGKIHPFRWQAEYGAFTIGRKQIPKAVRYVREQKEHHRKGSTIDSLESFS